jgi:predicted transcriptional regulator
VKRVTKHQQILRHIEQLPLGHKISVRQVAKELEVSEGTAYRAIKEAEARGLVTTVPRVGTIRIEVKQKLNIQQLTFAEVVNIVDGSILGGRAGLHKTLSQFLIGAMKLESMSRYVEAGSLLIVGDREEAQRFALDQGAGVLITGGFEASPAIRAIADEREIPVISSSYDTFTIATMINRAIHDRMIKKDIIRAEDVMVRDAHALSVEDTVSGWLTLSRRTGHSRFPVVDKQQRVVGIITGRDVVGANPDTPIERVMAKKPQMVNLKASISSVAHQMVWLGIEMMPVVENRKLRGVVTRSDVLKALQFSQRQPHVQMTHSDTILSQFSQELEEDRVTLRGKMPPVAMERGSVSHGSLHTVMMAAAAALLRQHRFQDFAAESINILFLHPVPLEQELEVTASLIDIGRQAAKVDITVLSEGNIVSRAMASVQNLNE